MADSLVHLTLFGVKVLVGLQVYKGRWNGVLVAVKVLNTAAAEVLEDFHRECAILERLRHPNIIKYFGTASNAEGQVSVHPGITLATMMTHCTVGTGVPRCLSASRVRQRLVCHTSSRRVSKIANPESPAMQRIPPGLCCVFSGPNS